jgi:hypothetical protein
MTSECSPFPVYKWHLRPFCLTIPKTITLLLFILTAVGLTPGGSSTVHIYIQTPGGRSAVHIYTQTPGGSSTVHIYTQTPGGRSAVHIYTQTVHRTKQL